MSQASRGIHQKAKNSFKTHFSATFFPCLLLNFFVTFFAKCELHAAVISPSNFPHKIDLIGFLSVFLFFFSEWSYLMDTNNDFLGFHTERESEKRDKESSSSSSLFFVTTINPLHGRELSPYLSPPYSTGEVGVDSGASQSGAEEGEEEIAFISATKWPQKQQCHELGHFL